MDVTDSRFPARAKTESDPSHVAIAVNLEACIHCNLCVRACREVQVNDVIGMAYRGHGAKIVFDFDDPMGDSTCVACGECVQACPTGALMEANLLDEAGARRPVCTSRTTRCSTLTVATGRPTNSASVSKGASVSTTRTIRTG
jgi:formate dehydrogenase major subunit